MAGGKNYEYLFVDGYNIIFAWKYLNHLADSSLEDARRKLLDDLSDYQAYSGFRVVVVFDAHNVRGSLGSMEKHDALTVIYTKENETADQYIERCAYELGRDSKVRVATSDSLEQVIIMGSGAVRLSASDLLQELKDSKRAQKEKYIDKKPIKRNMLFDNLDSDIREKLEKMIRQEGR